MRRSNARYPCPPLTEKRSHPRRSQTTPSPSSHASVISTYGASFSWRTRISVSRSASGAETSREERNCEVTARISVRPPVIRPRSAAGAQPFPRAQNPSAPRSRYASMSGWSGRRFVCSSPVKNVHPSQSAATPRKMRSVVPELPTSTTSTGRTGRPAVPVTIHSSPAETSAPKRRAASSAARVSEESSGATILEVPEAREARTTARIVCDFDPGISTSPARRDGATTSCIGGSLPEKYSTGPAETRRPYAAPDAVARSAMRQTSSAYDRPAAAAERANPASGAMQGFGFTSRTYGTPSRPSRRSTRA